MVKILDSKKDAKWESHHFSALIKIATGLEGEYRLHDKRKSKREALMLYFQNNIMLFRNGDQL